MSLIVCSRIRLLNWRMAILALTLAAATVTSNAFPAFAQSPTVPGEPTITTVNYKYPRNSKFFIKWDAPTDDGGSSITGYRIEIKPQSQALWAGGDFQGDNRTASQKQKTFVNLTKGVLYDIRLRAVNSVGSGEWVVTTARPLTQPSEPRLSQSGPVGEGVYFLRWSPPSDNGGTPITGYRVAWKLAQDNAIEYDQQGNYVELDATTREYRITTFDHRLDYAILLSAKNEVGSSYRTTTRSPVFVYGRPDPPTIGDVVPGNGTLTINWTPPSDVGRRSISAYKIRYRLESASGEWGSPGEPAEIVKSASDRIHKITGLTNGMPYEFAVRAVNEIGDGLWAESTGTPVAPPVRNTPLKPTIDDLHAHPTTIRVTWTAPDDDGGSAITGYKVQWRRDGRSFSETERVQRVTGKTTYTITGLSNRTNYDVRVTAYNANGDGEPSDVMSVQTIFHAPSAPKITDFSIPGPGMALVTYADSEDNGGNVITGYRVRYKEKGTSTLLSETEVTGSHTVLLSPLTAGSTYVVRIRAIYRGGGLGEYRDREFLFGNSPGAPSALLVTPGSTKLTLTWGAPTDIGHGTITSYDVEYKLHSMPWIDVARDDDDASTTQEITGLSNGQQYDVRVRAVSTVGTIGEGTWVFGTGTPDVPGNSQVTVPGAPAITDVAPGDGALTVSWSAPSNTGGADITSYDVEYKLGTLDTWTDVTRANDDDSTTQEITDLSKGRSYDVRVRAVNSVGSGEWAEDSGTPPVTVPGAPAITNVAPGDGALTVSWSAPSNTGGAAITSYDVEHKLDTLDTWTDVTRANDDDSTTQEITDLSKGRSYDVRVRAVNSVGSGEWAESSGTPPVTVPGAPAITNVAPGDGALTVSWTAPTETGGAAITSYDVEHKLGTLDTWTDVTRTDNDVSTTQVITDLSKGRSYDVRVRAVNSVGSGEWAESSGTPPVTVPGAPAITNVAPGDGVLTVSWSAPTETGGAAITSYDVEHKLGTLDTWTDVTRTDNDVSTTQVITDLSNGRTYNVRVRAVNSVGSGEWAESSGTPTVTVPGAPAITNVDDIRFREVFIKWDAPADDGGSPITGYRIEIKPNAQPLWEGGEFQSGDPSANVRQKTFEGLTIGAQYDVRVRAVNSVGSGEWAETTATPLWVPSRPEIDRHQSGPGNGTFTLVWTITPMYGGTLETGYEVWWRLASCADCENTVIELGPDVRSYTVTGLDNTKRYDFRLYARNAQGLSDYAFKLDMLAATKPRAPTIGEVTPGNGTLTINWTRPSDDGGRSINAYKIRYRLESLSGEWGSPGEPVEIVKSASDRSHEITGLDNGTLYEFAVRAVNEIGDGLWVESTGTPAGAAPETPTIERVESGNGKLTVTWTTPDDGGETITSYDVEYKLDTELTWTDVTRANDDVSTTQEITDLSNGRTYNVRVRAVNSVDSSEWAESSGDPNPSGVASIRITDTSGVTDSNPGNATARVFLRNIIESTTVYFRFGKRSLNLWFPTSETVASGATYVDIRMVDLVPALQVETALDVEASLESTFPTASTVPTAFTTTSAVTTAPGAPTLSNIDPGDGRLTVTWTAPIDTGGAIITAYEVQHKATAASENDWGDVPRSGADTSTTDKIIGLTNGEPYNVRVRAVNPRGGGVWAEGTGTPEGAATAPGVPTDIHVEPSSGALTVTWSAPVSDGGAEITSYDVRFKKSTEETWTDVSRTDSDTSTVQELTDLTNGLPYDVEVRAVNSEDDGQWAFVIGTPVSDVPGMPTITDVTPGIRALTVTWSEPESNGGSAITSYDVRHKEDTGNKWTDVQRDDDDDSTMQVMEDLKSGETYDVQVRAVNSTGGGEWADGSGTVPVVVPGAPTISDVLPGDGGLTVMWSAPESDGGATITSYDVQHKLDTELTWTDATRTDDDVSTTQEITDLSNGETYDVQVRAVNSVGDGEWASGSGSPTAARVTSIQITDTSSANAAARVFLSSVTGTTTIHLRLGFRATDTWHPLSKDVTSGAIFVDFDIGARFPFLQPGATPDVEASVDSAFPSGSTSSTVFTITSAVTTVPDAPAIDEVTPGESKLTVSWSAPTNTGGATITAYGVEHRVTPSGAWTDVTRGGADSTTTQEITSLNDGDSYDVRVRAINPRGPGAWVTRSGTRVGASSPPGAPTITSVEPDEETLTVNWTAPAEDGGTDISGYRVEWKLNTTASWVGARGADKGASATSHEITGLSNGIQYDIRVRASNSAHDGAWAEATEKQPGTPPGAPTIDGVVPGNLTLTVTWTAPSETGGVQISGYRVEWKEKIASSWTGQDLGADLRSYAIPNLSNGIEYDIHVAAVNAIDTGAWATGGGIPGAVPGVPGITGVDPGDGTLTVTWTAPENTGSSAIISYEVQYKETTETEWTDAGRGANDLATSQVIRGPTNGDAYEVRVRAVNSTGGGGWAVSEGTPGVPPGAPSIDNVKPEDRSLVVTWTAPTNPGSSEVTGYRLEWKGPSDEDWTGQDFGATSLSHTISGLSNGERYDIQVAAVNAIDTGAWATDSGTPATVPGAPTITDATPGDGEIALTWTAPTAVVGSDLTGYKVQWKSESQEYNESDRLHEADHQTTSYTITPLENGVRYTVRVIAVNGIGDGEPAERSVILIGVPNAPTDVRMTRGDGELVVEWDASEAEELRPVTDYVVRWKSGTQDYDPDDPNDPNDSARELVVASATLAGTIPGLDNGTEYTAKVQARNARGESEDSAQVSETPGKAPDAPTVTVTPGDSQLKVDWSEPLDIGGFVIIEYRVQWKSGTQEYNEADRQAVVTSGTTYTILGLTNGDAYAIRVLAVNEVDPGEPSDEWTGEAGLDTTISGVSVPGTPTQTEATVTVTIANQDSREETVYLRYREAATAPDGSWRPTQMVTTTTEESVDFTLSPLTANTEYEVEVSFENDFPVDSTSTATVLTASTVPDAPTEITLTPSDRQIQVSWVAPDDGGSPITGYSVEWASQDFNTSEQTTVGAGTLTHTFSTVGNGFLYEVVVTALNVNGESSPSEPVAGASSTLPEEPTNISVDRGASGELVVRWAPPVYDGDSEITGYVVQWKPSAESFDEDTPETVLEATARSHRITDLTDGELYDVRMLSVNGNGRSDPSQSVSIAPGVVAGAPTNVAVIHGNGQLTVTWQPPQGEVTPDTYTVEWKPSLVQSWSRTEDVESPHTIRGLTNGVLHDVRVLSVTGQLPGVPSGVVNDTPSTLPGEPTEVALRPGNSEIAVFWTAPADAGGAPITGYIVQWKPNAASWSDALSAGDTASPYTITTGLTNDAVYDVRVIALNLNGPSEPSTTASSTPVGLDLPGISTVTADEQSIASDEATVTVTIANQDEEPEAVYMRYRLAAPGNVLWSAIRSIGTTNETVVTFTLRGLDAYTEYQVQASLDIGFPADASPSTTFTTLSTVPGAPSNVVITPGDEELTINWSAPEDDGGSEISAFLVQWSLTEEEFSESNEAQVDDATTTEVISDLTNDHEYKVRVFALNENGTSEPSEIHTGTPTETVVTAVSGIGVSDITQSEAKVAVRIANQNDEPDTVYIRYRPVTPADSEWSATASVNTISETDVEFTLSGLAESTAYEVQASMDDSFQVDTSLSITFETLGTATQQSVVISEVRVARDGPTDATVTVELSALPEGIEATVYLRYRPVTSDNVTSGNAEWTATRQQNATSVVAQFALSGLQEAVEYEVQASLDESFLPDATQSAHLSRATLEKPLITEVLAGDGELTIVWAAPDISDVIGYDLRYTRAGDDWTVLLDILGVVPESPTPEPPVVVDECVADLGTLSDDVNESGEWIQECGSENRSDRYARYFSFTIEERLELSIDLMSDFDTYLFLLSGEGRHGEIEEENDDADIDAGNLDSRIVVELEAGTYTLEATTYEAQVIGNFTLTIGVAEPEPPTPEPPVVVAECVADLGTLSDDVTESGEWMQTCGSENRSDRYARYFSFTIEEGTELSIDLMSELDTYLFLLRGEGRYGEIVEENDDADYEAGNFDSRIVVDLDSGTYTLETTTYAAQAVGNFTLTIDVSEPDVAPAVAGAGLAGTYSHALSEHDGLRYTLTGLPNGVTYYVQVRAVTGAGAGAWSDSAEGTPAAASGVAPEPEPADTCVQSVESDGALEDSWDDTCLSEKEAPGGGGDRYARFYTFTLNEATDIVISLTSDEDTYLYVLEGHGKDGETLHLNDDIVSGGVNLDSRLYITLQPGDYTIEATTYSSEASGDFTLTIEGLGQAEESTPEPEPEPTPEVDTCVEPVDGDGTTEGSWDDTCLSVKAALSGTGDRYARFYTFTLDEAANVTITLESDEDTYLYVLQGHGKDGETLHSNDDLVYGVNTNSRLSENLQAGDYTIEATTYYAQTDGDFTLTIEELVASP